MFSRGKLLCKLATVEEQVDQTSGDGKEVFYYFYNIASSFLGVNNSISRKYTLVLGPFSILFVGALRYVFQYLGKEFIYGFFSFVYDLIPTIHTNKLQN